VRPKGPSPASKRLSTIEAAPTTPAWVPGRVASGIAPSGLPQILTSHRGHTACQIMRIRRNGTPWACSETGAANVSIGEHGYAEQPGPSGSEELWIGIAASVLYCYSQPLDGLVGPTYLTTAAGRPILHGSTTGPDREPSLSANGCPLKEPTTPSHRLNDVGHHSSAPGNAGCSL
jgi:hypothetical protein